MLAQSLKHLRWMTCVAGHRYWHCFLLGTNSYRIFASRCFLKMHGGKMIELPTRSKYLIYRYALSTRMISYNINLFTQTYIIHMHIHAAYVVFLHMGRPMRCIWVFFRELHMFGAAIWKFWPRSRCHSDGKQVNADMDAKRQKKTTCAKYILEKKNIYVI